ncbi:hypothetical protein AB0G05_26740 [Nonomuraea wenchangensis]
MREALAEGAERYIRSLFFGEEPEGLTSRPPAGIAPLLLVDADASVLDAQLIVAAHLRRLRARPRRHVPPALIPTLTHHLETSWPRPTR